MAPGGGLADGSAPATLPVARSNRFDVISTSPRQELLVVSADDAARKPFLLVF